MVRILEMALEREKILSDMRGASGTYMSHLIKIYFYRDESSYVDDWIDEIFDYYGVPDIPKKNQRLKEKDVYESIYGHCKENYKLKYTGFIRSINKKTAEVFKNFRLINVRKVDYDEINSFIDDCSRWIAHEIDVNKCFDPDEFGIKVKSLLKNYNKYLDALEK